MAFVDLSGLIALLVSAGMTALLAFCLLIAAVVVAFRKPDNMSVARQLIASRNNRGTGMALAINVFVLALGLACDGQNHGVMAFLDWMSPILAIASLGVWAMIVCSWPPKSTSSH